MRPGATLRHSCGQAVVGTITAGFAGWVQQTQVLVFKIVDKVFGKNDLHVVRFTSKLDTTSC